MFNTFNFIKHYFLYILSDVKDVSLVINYDFPRDLQDFPHRVGRTGRAGREGRAVSFITDEAVKLARPLAQMLERSGQPISDGLKQVREQFYILVIVLLCV